MTVYGYEYFGRPYVYGEAPGPSAGVPSAGAPLSGIRRRLGKLIGVSEDEMAELFVWKNLLDEWPGYGPGGGSKFPASAARHRARFELARFRPLTLTTNRPFIYLGKRVAKAFDFDGEWLVWSHDQAVCPHPSGLNRWWNDSEHVEQARAFWENAAIKADHWLASPSVTQMRSRAPKMSQNEPPAHATTSGSPR